MIRNPLTYADFLPNIYRHRHMIGAMALQEIRARYAGTMAGLAWTVSVPLVTAFVFAFVFSVGLRVPDQQNVPFVVMFFCSLIAWNLMSDTLTQNSAVIVSHAYLVKKVVFPTEILPLVNLAANLIIHGTSVVILLGLMVVYGLKLSPYVLQFVYFAVCMCVLTLALSWLVASVNVFFRDLGQFVAVFLQIWFWVTPIVWSLELFPEKYRVILRLNPMTYITEGYRASFLFARPCWEDYVYGAYFWAATLLMLLVGATVFRRLKPEFADML